MVRMALLGAAAVGRSRRLVDLWATAPSAVNWQEPLGQESFPSLWSTLSRQTRNSILFTACFFGLVIVCWTIHRIFCRNNNDDDDQDTNRFVLGNNNDDGQGVSSPPAPLQEQLPLPESGDGHEPGSNTGEDVDTPPRRRRRQRQQPPTVAEMPATEVEMALGDMQLMQDGVEWMLPNLELLAAPAADVDMAPAADEEIAPPQEPGPTLKCTYSTAAGWDEGTCSVCLSELIDGEKVRVLTACMHCFHAKCIERWLRENATCPICRTAALVPVARGRRRRRTQT